MTGSRVLIGLVMIGAGVLGVLVGRVLYTVLGG